jgi:predicted dehydrogenase
VGGRGFESLEAALDWQPEVAVICTPPAQHVSAARACVEAGCDLLVEKPLSASPEGLDELVAAIARHGAGAAVAYHLRFHPAIARLRALVRGGALGRLLVIRAEFGQYLPDWRPSRDYRDTYTAQPSQGGGILLDASHELDYVRWIAGDITGVFARAERLSDLSLDVEDTAALLLRMERGVLGEVHVDCVQRGYTRGCTLIGTEATVRWDVASGLTMTGAAGAIHEEPLTAEPNAPYLAELGAFLSARDAVDPFASIDDARRVLAVALAARRSSAERREISL